MKVEILDKKKGLNWDADEDFIIDYGGTSIPVKNFETEEMYIFGVIIQENGNYDLLFKKKDHERRL